MPTQLETRTIKTEVRTSKNKFALEGTAASFNVNSQNLGGFVERIAPGAFARSLRENADVKCTFNHDISQILGRTKSGTLSLSTDSRGLNFRCELDPTNTAHQNIYASVKRGDISECSFAFIAPKDGSGESWADGAVDDKGLPCKLRTLHDVDLKDVAVVTHPAYNAPDATSVDARAAAAAHRRTSTLTDEECARLQGVDVATLHRKDLAIRRGVATRQGQKIAAHETQELRRRAAALGAQIAADNEQARRDNAMQRRAEGILGIVFGKKSHPERTADSGAVRAYPFKLASDVANRFPDHSLVSADSQMAYTKTGDGMKYSIPYSQNADGSHSFGKPALGGHPVYLQDEDVS